MTILEQIERVVPRVRLYPRWAQGLFASAFAMTLLSFFLWVVMAPTASTNKEHKSVQLDLGLGDGQKTGTSRHAIHAPGAVNPTTAADQTMTALDAPITYELTGRTIAAKVPYLALVRRGGPIGGVNDFEWWDEAETFPKLDVKLANTGPRTAFITAAIVHVDHSVPDREPAPIVFAGRRETPRAFSLTDEGWGNMENVTLNYDVAQGLVEASFERRGPYLSKRDSDGYFDVSKGIRSQNLSPHGIATVWGVLSYRWRDSSRARHLNRVKTVTTVYLAAGSPSVGAPAPISGTYDVELRVRGRDYDVLLQSFDRFIKPQSPDRFEIRIHARRSSIHAGVRVKLRYSDGYIQNSAPVMLRLFSPRNAPSAES